MRSKTELKLIREVFNELDLIILACQSESPVPFNQSSFKLNYGKIKEKWLR
jgi:hypothetical protein